MTELLKSVTDQKAVGDTWTLRLSAEPLGSIQLRPHVQGPAPARRGVTSNTQVPGDKALRARCSLAQTSFPADARLDSQIPSLPAEPSLSQHRLRTS